jgi:hypothetical protein
MFARQMSDFLEVWNLRIGQKGRELTGASVDDGPNVELSLTPSLCEDVFWRLPHFIYPPLFGAVQAAE